MLHSLFCSLKFKDIFLSGWTVYSPHQKFWVYTDVSRQPLKLVTCLYLFCCCFLPTEYWYSVLLSVEQKMSRAENRAYWGATDTTPQALDKLAVHVSVYWIKMWGTLMLLSMFIWNSFDKEFDHCYQLVKELVWMCKW